MYATHSYEQWHNENKSSHEQPSHGKETLEVT